MSEILRRVGRYEVIEVIGRGGASVVYVAHQRDLDRRVALKELAPFYAIDRRFAERFVQESRLTAAMNHPNIVTVHEYFEEGGSPYIAMEYMQRGSLRPFIGRLDTAAIIGVLEDVLAGLEHGERLGIVHRDLKPENLLMADDGRVKIADFGVARAINHATPRGMLTATGTVIGTPGYMAPEQALGGELTPATDLYSLGIVVWELLAARAPFDPSDNPAALLYKQAHEAVPPIRTVAPRTDEGLAGWLERMLAKQPKDRFQSAQRAWEQLDDLAIALLGPRWRRASRLRLAEAEIDGAGPSASRVGDAGPSASRQLDSTANGLGAPADEDEPHDPVATPSSPRSPPAETVEPVSPAPQATRLRQARRHRSSPAPSAGPHRPRLTPARRIALAAGLLASAIAAVVLAVVLSGHTGRRPAASTKPPVTLKAGVVSLNRIVQSFIAGKQLSRAQRNYQAAVQNRTAVLEALKAFNAPPQLRSAVQTLTNMTIDSLAFNQDMLTGQTARARAPDNAHNALRRQFVAQFSPDAQRYLGVRYTINEL